MTTGLTRQSSDPLHEQLASLLRLQAHRLEEGAAMPSDFELAQKYSLSRSTVRRAIQTLVDEGLVIRRQGKGTFVSSPKFTHELDNSWAFAETFTAHGLQPESELTEFRWLNDRKALPARLDASVLPALFFQRRYLFDGRPLAYADAYIREPYARQLARSDIEEHPSFEVIQAKCGVNAHHVTLAVGGIAAESEHVEQLDVPLGSPVLVLQRWIYAEPKDLLQYSIHFLPTEHFEFHLTSPTRMRKHEQITFRVQHNSAPPLDSPMPEADALFNRTA